MVIEMNRVHPFVVCSVCVSLFLVLLCLVEKKKEVPVVHCTCMMHSSLEFYKLPLLSAKRPYLHEVVRHVIIILMSVIDYMLSLNVKLFFKCLIVIMNG